MSSITYNVLDVNADKICPFIMLRTGLNDGRARVEAINSLPLAACRQVFVVRELRLAGAEGKSTNPFLDKKN